eukprot:GCRY01000051.1.p1 GENE.GCRY01000051.1~~GCRY01000051.1.p1  ORF type:complete len:316 (+),score=18.20 GCRY01000051.1:395-1342(+)
MPCCGKSSSQSKMFKCPQCLPPSGLLCEDCYKKGKHSKHEGSCESDSSGTCDCGSHYYINRENCCEDHPIPNGGQCGNRRGKMYKCSCMKNSSSLLCEHCIKEGKHKSHDYEESNSSGTCDCGNDSYIPEDAWCEDHPGYALLTGRCYYKSGFCKQKGHGAIGGFQTHERWFQCRHTEIYYFTDKQHGYNMPDPGQPKADDPDSKLHFPDLSMPSLSMPSMSMPSLSMPSLGKPSLSMKRKTRQKNPLGRFSLSGTTVKKSGSKVTVSGVRYERFYEGSTPSEFKDKQTFSLNCPDKEQAESWYETLVYGGSTGK